MLRMESETGWWLIKHPDHAELAGAFAAAWGNVQFRKPEPRARVLFGICRHDDGWAVRDEHPVITSQGKPSAFSRELVGKYSAFEEIDIAEYLAVRDRAVRIVADKDPYAGLLISMHTYNLLAEHADRTTIAREGLALLDAFLEQQRAYQRELRATIHDDASLSKIAKTEEMIVEHFHLLQACDNLSLLACVAYDFPATLLHPLPLTDGAAVEVQVTPIGLREFKLSPWPFEEAVLRFSFPARHIEGKTFRSSADLNRAYSGAEEHRLSLILTA
jgi:Protein of unknown function (DUF3891)